MSGLMRNMVESDENSSAEQLLSEFLKEDPSAQRICKKKFQSQDGTIKVWMASILTHSKFIDCWSIEFLMI